MDIQLTEEQELLRSSLQRLLRDQYNFETRRKIVATEEGWSRGHWNMFAEMGLLAAPFSETVGGLGGGPVATMIVMQEFGRNLVVEPFLETVVLAGGLIEDAGTDAQREECLPPIMAGEAVWALAWTEGHVFTFSIPGISIGGPLGGLVGGAVAALFVTMLERRGAPSSKLIEGVGLVVLCAAAVAGALLAAEASVPDLLQG